MKRRRLVLLVVLPILVGLLFWLGASGLIAWRLTQRKCPPFPEPVPEVTWGSLEDLRLTTCDRHQIGAWLVRGDRGRGSILLVHGNGGSRRDMLAIMEWLAEARFTVLTITLRAHGDSTGQFNDLGLSARHDVGAAVEFLERERPQEPVYVVGRSLGAAAAIFAAGDLQERVAGYFLEQPYKNLRSAVWNRVENRLPPILDSLAYLGLRLWAPVVLGDDLDAWSLDDRIEDIPPTLPIVVITGSADRHARLEDVEAIFHRVESHARLVVVEGAAHEALDRKDPDLYRAALLGLLTAKSPHCAASHSATFSP